MSPQPNQIGNFEVIEYPVDSPIEEIFKDIPYDPGVIQPLTEEEKRYHGAFTDRLRRSVELHNHAKLTFEQYINERNLASLCHEFKNDQLASWTVDQALDQASGLIGRASERFFKLAECLERRQTYTERVF